MDSHEELQAFVEDPAANDGSQLPSALTRRAALAAASTAAATASPAATEAASAATVQATLDATADAVEAKRAWAGTCLTNNSESARNHRQCCRQVCIRDPSNSEQQLQRREQVELQLDEFDPARATIPSTDGVCGCRRAFGWKGRHHGGVVLAGCSEGSCEAPAGNCHGHRHHHHHHHHRHHGGSSSSNGSSCRRNRRRCGCHLGEYMFMLIPRKPLSAGASFLFSLLQEASPTVRCAVDMGGTLAKVVFIEELGPHSAAAAAAAAAAVAAGGSTGFSRRDPQLTARAYASNCDAALDLASPLLTIRASPRRVLRFTYFRTKAISSLLECLRTRNLVKGGVLRMTGGGAMKYAKLFTQQLGVSLQRTDEIESIMAGLVLLASHTNSVFRFDLASRQRVPVDVSRDLYPFLVVNIGSGVSILKAKSASSFVRVTGTCIGGGTVLGLARLLFHAKSFRQVVRLSERGTDALDLKVADLCGDAAGSRCIAPDALASSFGRLYLDAKGDRPRPRKEDIARSLIHMVSYNLGYLAYLVGTAHGVRRIFFAGKFINNYDFTMESITQGVNFYMQQYDQHTPQTCLRGPASPLLAAPPNFNVSAQQRILLQQQLLISAEAAKRQALAAVDPESKETGRAVAAADAVAEAEVATEASGTGAVLPPQGTSDGAAAPDLCEGSMADASSPIALPSRPQVEGPEYPHKGQLHEQQQQQQRRQQTAVGSPLRSPSCPPLGISSNCLFNPSSPASTQAGVAAEPAAPWAPFEVLFLRHDGYLGAVGALVAPGPNLTSSPP